MRRLLGLAAVVLGVLGAAGCAAGVYGVRLVTSRLDQTNEKVFDAIDSGLGVVEDRVPVVQRRVKDAKIAAAEVTDTVQVWASKKIQDRVVTELEVEKRVERLSGQLQSADFRLEASTQTVHDIRRMMELSQSLGARVDPSSTDDLLALLATLRGEVQQAEKAVDEVRRFAVPGPGESIEDKLARVAKVLTRVLLTLSDVDRHIDRFKIRLSEVRVEAQQLKQRTSRYILWGAVVCYAILAWIGAGQVALVRYGWSCNRRHRHVRLAESSSPTTPG